MEKNGKLFPAPWNMGRCDPIEMSENVDAFIRKAWDIASDK